MKNWQTFLACLALSAGIWLIHNLSHMQTGLVSVSVIALSNIDGRAGKSSDEVSLTAKCRASGFRLLYLRRKSTPVTVTFSSEDFRFDGGDAFSIPSSQLHKYSSDLFGPGVIVESFLADELRFRFMPESCRKVPVRAVTSFSFRPQYIQMSQIRLKPDSVLVYGPSEIISSIPEVRTRSIVKSDIKGNLHGEVRLEAPSSLRLSSESTEWELDVTRYVETACELPVRVRNVPAGVSLSVYPPSVQVAFKCVFPVLADPSSSVCYVDYAEFQKSLTGHCMIQFSDLPPGVIECSASPSTAECIETLL